MCAATTTPLTGQESLGFLIGLVRSELVRALEAELASDGIDLRFTQFLALKRLATVGPMTAGELARSLDHDAGAMTRLLDQLERKGYLRRCPHAQDRRALRIEMTEAGKQIWQRTASATDRLLEHMQRDLDPREREQLHDFLGRILATLRSTD